MLSCLCFGQKVGLTFHHAWLNAYQGCLNCLIMFVRLFGESLKFSEFKVSFLINFELQFLIFSSPSNLIWHFLIQNWHFL